MSSDVNPDEDRRKNDVEWRRQLAERLSDIDTRLAVIEKETKDKAKRRAIIREFFDDCGRWIVYGGKLVGSVLVIGGALVALVAWMARNG